MIYLHLTSEQPFKQKLNINPSEFKILEEGLNHLKVCIGTGIINPFDFNPIPTSYATNFFKLFEPEFVEQIYIKEIGYQFNIPMTKPVVEILEEIEMEAEQVLDFSLGFNTHHGNLFMTPSSTFFKPHKTKGAVPLKRFMTVDINTFKTHEAFNLTLLANHTSSIRMWIDFFSICILQVESIKHGNNKKLIQTKQEIIQHFHKYLDALNLQLEAI